MADSYNDRPLRVCDLCGGVDRDPRHSIAGTIPGHELVAAPSEDTVNKVLDAAPSEHRARLLRDLMDTSTTDRHLDCCAEAGCPAPTDDPLNCANIVAGSNGKTGKGMLAHSVAYREQLNKEEGA